jgi:hypothetical protein
MSQSDRIETVFERHQRGIPDQFPEDEEALELVSGSLAAAEQAFLDELAEAIGHHREEYAWKAKFWLAVERKLSPVQAEQARIVAQQFADARADVVFAKCERSIPARLPENAAELVGLIKKIKTVEQTFSEELADAIEHSRRSSGWKTTLWHTAVSNNLSHDRLQRALSLRGRVVSMQRGAQELLPTLTDNQARIVLTRYESRVPKRLPDDVTALQQVVTELTTAKQTFPQALADAIGHNQQTAGLKTTVWHLGVSNKLSQDTSQRVSRLQRQIHSVEREARKALANARADIVLARYGNSIPEELPDSREELAVLSGELASMARSFFRDLADAIGHSREALDWRTTLWKSRVLDQLSEDRTQRATVLRQRFNNTGADIVFAIYENIISQPLPESAEALAQLNGTLRQKFLEDLADAIQHSHRLCYWKGFLSSKAVQNGLSEDRVQRARVIRDRICSFGQNAEEGLANARADIVFARYEGSIPQRLPESQEELAALGKRVATMECSFFKDLAGAISHSRGSFDWETKLWQPTILKQLSGDRVRRARILRQRFADARADIVFARYESVIPGEFPDHPKILEELLINLATFPEELADAIGHDRRAAGWESPLWGVAVPNRLSADRAQRAVLLRDRIRSFERDARNLATGARVSRILARYEGTIPERLPDGLQELEMLSQETASREQSFFEELAEAIGLSREVPSYWALLKWHDRVINNLPTGNSQARLLRQQFTDARVDIVLAKFEQTLPALLPVSLEALKPLHQILRSAERDFEEELADAVCHSHQSSGWEERLWQTAIPNKLSERRVQRACLLRERFRSFHEEVQKILRPLVDQKVGVILSNYERAIPAELPNTPETLDHLLKILAAFPADLADAIGHNRQAPKWESALWRTVVSNNLSKELAERARLLSGRIRSFDRDARNALARLRAVIVLARYEGTIPERLPDGSQELEVLSQEIAAREQTFFEELAEAIGLSRESHRWAVALWTDNVLDRLLADKPRARLLRQQFTDIRTDIVFAKYEKLLREPPLPTPEALKQRREILGSAEQNFSADLADALRHNRLPRSWKGTLWRIAISNRLSETRVLQANLLRSRLCSVQKEAQKAAAASADRQADGVLTKDERAIPSQLPDRPKTLEPQRTHSLQVRAGKIATIRQADPDRPEQKPIRSVATRAVQNRPPIKFTTNDLFPIPGIIGRSQYRLLPDDVWTHQSMSSATIEVDAPDCVLMLPAGVNRPELRIITNGSIAALHVRLQYARSENALIVPGTAEIGECSSRYMYLGICRLGRIAVENQGSICIDHLKPSDFYKATQGPSIDAPNVMMLCRTVEDVYDILCSVIRFVKCPPDPWPATPTSRMQVSSAEYDARKNEFLKTTSARVRLPINDIVATLNHVPSLRFSQQRSP